MDLFGALMPSPSRPDRSDAKSAQTISAVNDQPLGKASRTNRMRVASKIPAGKTLRVIVAIV
jgi:hypothetical protein